MLLQILVAAILFFPAGARAEYDASWFVADGWSGEFASGFAVLKPGVKLAARRQPERSAPAELSCELPFRANFHPDNPSRKFARLTATKVTELKARRAFHALRGQSSFRLKKGETAEFLGFETYELMRVRRGTEIHKVDRSFLPELEYDYPAVYGAPDEWLQVPCGEGAGWLLYSELAPKNPEGDREFLPGLGDSQRGLREDGTFGDLTDEGLRKPRMGFERFDE